MFRLSNNLIGFLNLIVLLLSIPILIFGGILSSAGTTDCEKFFQKPALALGIFLLAVSLAGFIGACFRVSWLLWIYLVINFFLIVLIFCFTVFSFVVTNKGAGEIISGRGYRDYHLGDYSHWLQKRVDNSDNWDKIKSCIQDTKICLAMQKRKQTMDQFINDNLSPLQSGCCKPPTSCNFTYEESTVWIKNSNLTSDDPDCVTWSNDQSSLCYECMSCKAGVLANLRTNWKKMAIVNIGILILLVIVYSVGCCAFRNNRYDDSRTRRGHWKGGYPS